MDGAPQVLEEALSEVAETERDRLISTALTLFLREPGAENASLFEMKEQEILSREEAKLFVELAAKVDVAALVRLGVEINRAATEVAQAFAGLPSGDRDGIQPRSVETPVGTLAIGGPRPDEYGGILPVLLIELGGDDRYITDSLSVDLARPTTVLIDLSGDDTHRGLDRCQGAGFFGWGVLIDIEGHDTYRARNLSQGMGLFGIGVLDDWDGDDRYEGDSGVQGAGAFGWGMLADGSGLDHYTAQYSSQAIGSIGGLGIIHDASGNDLYISGGRYEDVLRYDDHYTTLTQGVGLGWRPYASGGIGLLVDDHGNDTYSCDIYGQGAAYWYGIGGLVDVGGHDVYLSHQYAQGSGIHLAGGVLIDADGDDTYRAHGVAQGCGHDLAIGALFDRRGNDTYICDDLSQGGGNANAISLLADLGGADNYVARKSNTQGYSDRRRGYGMIGVAIDLGGPDRYASPVGQNDGWWTQSTYGVGMNVERASAPDPLGPPPDGSVGKTAEQIRSELGGTPDSLFVQASAAPQRYQYLVQPARDSLVALPDSVVVPFFADRLGSESARERWALIRTAPRVGSAMIPMLIDSLNSDNKRARGMSIYLLGKMKSAGTIEPLVALMRSADTLFYASAARSLGWIGDEVAADVLVEGLLSDMVSVRREAARALGSCGRPQDMLSLVDTLNDTSQMVRYAAQGALSRHDAAAGSEFLESLPSMTDRALAHALLAIAEMDTVPNNIANDITAYLNSNSWPIRHAAATALKSHGGSESASALDHALTDEKHALVRQAMVSARDAASQR